ncbi:MAG: hypothetical protein KA506_11570 [Steroidobacteraceae bacterium]|nr:hypothetical protein [Steroidobacteraceae bacterium]
MSRPFDVRLPLEQAYLREAMLAVELLDPVTLERVSQGVKVTAVGLASTPVVNFGELFVWLTQPMTNFEKLIIEPGTRPFERMEVAAAQVQLPLHTVELKPLANYPFTPGITAIRGSLYEMKVPLGTTPVPIPGAAIRLAWLHEDNVTWIPSPATAVTNTQGEFTLILRLAPVDVTALDAQGKMSIRLFAKRAAGGEKKHEFQLPHGRVADAVYAWDELL